MLVVGLLIGLVVLVGLGVLGLGALVLWGSARNVWERWAAFVSALQSRGWAETEGTIVRSVVAHRRFRRHVSYEPAIRYEYWVGGQRLEGERRSFDELDVGSWLDRHDLELGASVSGDRRPAMNVARLHEGDPVLVAGKVFRDSGGERVLRAREGEPLSLLFSDKPWAATLEELGKGPRATLAWGAAGVLSILLGAVALLS